MNRWFARALALLLGVCLAFVFLIGVAALNFPNQVLDSVRRLTGRFLGDSTRITLAPSPTVDCLELSETLQLGRGFGRDLFQPMQEKQIKDHRRFVRAEFSGHWAETRVVQFRLKEPAVEVQAYDDTDCGLYIGSVDSKRSSVHLHASALCFDLVVRGIDSPAREERWRGQIQLE